MKLYRTFLNSKWNVICWNPHVCIVFLADRWYMCTQRFKISLEILLKAAVTVPGVRGAEDTYVLGPIILVYNKILLSVEECGRVLFM